MHLFVYGTLKRGYNNNIILRGAKYIGPDKTPPKYDIFPYQETGGFPIVKDGEFSIKGEVFDITDSMLKNCDKLEGHPNFYERRPIKLLSGRFAFFYYYKLNLCYDPDNFLPGIVKLGNTKFWQDLKRFKPEEFIP